LEATAPPRAAISLRPVAEEDLAFLRRVYFTTREDEMRRIPWPEERKRHFLEQQFAAQKKHYDSHFPDCAFRVIEMGGEPIGRLYVDRSASHIEIVDIALLPGHRGRGVGRMLIEEVLAEAGGAGRAVRIYVEQYNPARRLYDRLGFVRLESNGVYDLMEWRGAP
jgi:ribosomal protein S18 acetylase RimI-like enzyme